MDKKLIEGAYIEPGDLLVGFKEGGFRSVGLAVADSSLRMAFGKNWHDESIEVSDQSLRLGKLALRPPAAYDKAIKDMTTVSASKAQVNCITEIGSGGIPEQLGRTLRKTGLGAEIVDPFETPTIAMLAQAFHPDNISDEEAYRTWCMGQGMIVGTLESDTDDVIRVAAEHGIAAKIIGYVTREPGIRIRSAGIHKTGKMLSFEA